MRKVLSIGLLLAVLLCTFSVAQAAGVNLAFKYKAGEVCNYKVVSTMCVNIPGSNRPMEMHMSGDITEKVLAVKKDGNIKLQIKMRNMKTVMTGGPNGQSSRKIPDQTSTITINKYGRVISSGNKSSSFVDSASSGDLSSIMSNVAHYGLLLPGKTISAGNNWKQVVPIPNTNAKINIINTLLAASVPYGKQQASKIKQSASAKMDLATIMAASMKNRGGVSSFKDIKGSVNVSGSTVYHFSAAQGKLLKSSGSYKVVTKIVMPQSARKQGAPANINTVSTITASMIKK
ncbi:MAG: hypothetical protein ABFD64_08380 [Armatimonadota bacterium]